MPDLPPAKIRPRLQAKRRGGSSAVVAPHRYAELHVTSNYTFLTGASHPEEYIAEAANLGLEAIAVTDLQSVAGIVRAHAAAKEAGVRFIVGSRVRLELDPSRPGESVDLLVYPTDLASYGRLCRLLTLGKRRGGKGECWLGVHDLVDHHQGLLGVMIPPARLDQSCLETVECLRGWFRDDRLSIAVSMAYGQDDRDRLRQIASLSSFTGVPLVVTNDVHYHASERRALQDVLTCIRHGCSIQQAGYRLFPNAERCLKPPEEMHRLFGEHPEALRRSVEIVRRAGAFSLESIRYQYPDEVCPPGVTAMEHLTALTWAGAAERYPQGVPAKVRDQIVRELALIDELRYASYFLTVHELVHFARGQRILCQGRGAAANSAICYCLQVTAVDPDRVSLLFERFISRERNEPPDIDIDFEHERREEVIQHIYGKYGRDRAALTAEVISYRGRSAIREVGKALGFSLDPIDRLAKEIDWWGDQKCRMEGLRRAGVNPDDPTVRRLVQLSAELQGFPRHLSQHVGGFVITKGPLCEVVPIENARMEDRTVIEWDKDDIDELGLLKVDVLGLGMLTAVRKCIDLINDQGGHEGRSLEFHTIPPEEEGVYDMICRADTVGVFQIESRAQMQMLPRLKPRCYYDLVIEVAIVRPGPIHGDMVHPYLRRRRGEEQVEKFDDPKVEAVLSRTLGVPLFQEQAMALAMAAAGFTAGEADQLRRAIAAWKTKTHQILAFGEKLIQGMVARGYPTEFAERCFNQLKGFSEYGFPESHAASFALIVYASCWLKHHYPAAFAAALINSQPMGFYAPAQLVRDAQEHGVEARPVDVNFSHWDCTLERASAPGASSSLRLGMRLVKGLRQEHAQMIADVVEEQGPFTSVEALWRASGVPVSALRHLARADAFTSMKLDRQAALWQARALHDCLMPLFDEVEPKAVEDGAALLPAIHPLRKVTQDYGSVGLSLKAHPVAFIRPLLDRRKVACCGELRDGARWRHGRAVTVAGLALVRQRPGTASGVVFITLEDETGVANLIVRPRVFERYRRAARHGRVLLARGTVERDGDVIHIMTRSIQSLDSHFSELTSRSRDFH